MSLQRLKLAPTVLIQDDININVIPLLLELIQEQNSLKVLCLEHTPSVWKSVFASRAKIDCYNYHYEMSGIKERSSVLIDSVNQLSLSMGWKTCLNFIKKMKACAYISQLILINHKDCISNYSKVSINLCHLADAIVTYSGTDVSKVNLQIRKSGKLVKSEENLSLENKTNTLKFSPTVKAINRDNEIDRPQPASLSTFKIEVGQTEKLEKYKLKLPYMNKINEGQSTIYYEPDAVDDWDEEDPDDDLNI